MNLIKHLANMLAVWTIPYIIVLFFLLVTGFAFTYNQAISSVPFIIIYTLYFILSGIMYISVEDEDLDSIKLFKTN